MSRYINTDQVFFKDDGTVNALGYLYFGEPNTDAKTNPKNPFADADYQTPLTATQQLTSGGKLQQKTYLNGDYSVISEDVDNVQIDEDQNAAIITQTADDIDYRVNTSVGQFLGNTYVDDYAELRALTSAELDDNDYIFVAGYPDPWQVKTGTVTDNGWYLVFDDDSNRYAESTSNVADITIFGALPMLGDAATACQSAADLGIGLPVVIPEGSWNISTFTVAKQIEVRGYGMDTSIIVPITGNSTIVVATDNVYLHDFTFLGKTGTGQADIFGSCIEFDAVTNNPAFMRHMEGCKVERVRFRNLKMNGIYVSHLLRESHIRECRFVGMGNQAAGTNGIKLENTKGSASNINNLWIEKNMFYRFDSPPINAIRSPLLGGSAISFADIWIRQNLIHGQLLDESGGGVEPELSDHVKMQDASNVYAHNNNFTSIHPLKVGIRITSVGEIAKSVIVTDNNFSHKSTVDGVTYSRTVAPLATGNHVQVIGSESVITSNNQMTGGTFVDDILVTNGDYTTTIDANITGNTSQAGSIVTNYIGLGTWRGQVEETDLRHYKSEMLQDGDVTITGQIDIDASAISSHIRDSSALAMRYSYNDATAGAYIGSPAANQFQVSSSGGTPLLVVETTAGTRPGADNVYSSGTAANRWSVVYAGTGSINTSDGRMKTEIQLLDEAELRVAARIKPLIRKYKMLEAVANKGDSARWHIGVIAQEVIKAFESEGLDSLDYGVVCYDEWGAYSQDTYSTSASGEVKVSGQETVPAGNRYGIRYDELIMFMLTV